MASEKLEAIIKEIDELTVLELNELVKALEEKYDVTAAAPMAMAMAPAAGAAQLGLKEAKALVDTPPKPIKEDISKEEAEEIKAKIEAAGGAVEIK